jgi:hypothetical protein
MERKGRGLISGVISGLLRETEKKTRKAFKIIRYWGPNFNWVLPEQEDGKKFSVLSYKYSNMYQNTQYIWVRKRSHKN